MNLSSFAEALQDIIQAKKEIFTLAICSQTGITRLVPVSVNMINEWRSNNRSLLGC